MKRFLVVLITLLFAASAYAQQAEEKKADFTYGISGLAYGIQGSQKDFAYDYSHIRVRPSFSLTKENVTAFMKLEIDQDFGRERGAGGADPGTDNIGVEVKNAYVQIADLIIPKLSLTAGLVPVFFPYVVDNDLAAYLAAYDFGMGSIALGYIKIDEFDQESVKADKTSNRDDAQAYVADINIKPADKVNIRPFFVYITSGSNDSANNAIVNTGDNVSIDLDRLKVWDASANITGDFGIFAFDVTGSYLSGKEDKTGGTKLKGWAADGIIYIKPVEMAKLGLFCTFHSGDKDGTTDNKVEGYNYILESALGAADGRLFLIEAAGVATNGGTCYYDQTDGMLGLLIYGANVEVAIDKVTLFAQYGYVQTAEDNAAGDNVLGQEVDVRISYAVNSFTSIFVEGGYYIAGDDTYTSTEAFSDGSTTFTGSTTPTKDNGWEAAFGVQTSL